MRLSRPVFLQAGLALALAAGPAAHAAEGAGRSEGERVLRRLTDAFQSMETFQAQFVQTQVWVGMEEEAESRGTLSLKRPNLFRIEYGKPAGHLQVSDGQTVWTYVPENGEVLSARLGEGPGQGGDLLRWILQNSRALPEVGSESLDGRTVQQLRLVPAEGLGLSQVRLWIAPGSIDLLQYEITDSSGNRSVYRLSKVRRNPNLPDALFRFAPPPGIPVVEIGSP